MSISIKDQKLTDSKVPGSTDLSLKIKSTNASAKVTITLKSKVNTVIFTSNSSDEIDLSTNHQISNSWKEFEKKNIKIKGSLPSGTASIKFNVKATDNANANDSEDKDVLMTVKP